MYLPLDSRNNHAQAMIDTDRAQGRLLVLFKEVDYTSHHMPFKPSLESAVRIDRFLELPRVCSNAFHGAPV